MQKLPVILVALIAIGCGSQVNPTETAATQPVRASATGDPSPRMGEPVSAPRSREPFATVPKISASNIPTSIHVDIYQLSVPYGTVSRNEKFWKRIDENCVDVTTYDTLFKNGIRVGLAPTAEWEHFKNIMEEHPAVTRMNSLVSFEGRTVELPMRKQVQRQHIFYLDSAGAMQGRTFDASENLVAMVLQPAPRKPDTIRFTMCPLVRATRKRLEYSALNREEPEVTYVQPERLYDLNLRVDVPVEAFFVVAPSGEATWPTSVGNNFFVSNGAAERMETVLLMVPRIVKIQEPAAPPGAKPKKAQ